MERPHPDLPRLGHRRHRRREGHAVLRGPGRSPHRAERRQHSRTYPMTPGPAPDTTLLESRRRLAFRAAVIALLVAIVGFPLGTTIGGLERGDTAGGAL